MSQPRHPAELSPKREPPRRLALKPYARAVAQVLRVSFRASPAAVVL
jgi:ATP-binding cassette subfamily B protein/ATP-binding cassette subfamily C protein